ncbi:MAG: histidine phosphatase family protein [Streptococcus sp.]|nr:histidine phosphatase family protein [Streptococcus sp.]
MRILFVRHSEPDYSCLDKLGASYCGFGRDLAPLSEFGRKLVNQTAKHPIFKEAQVVIASSVTRALETATYIVKEHQLPLLVEPLFHEWRPDKRGLNYKKEEVCLAYKTFLENEGSLPTGIEYYYETAEEVRNRFLDALDNYRQYDCVVIVAHSVLIRQFCKKETIDYCEVIEANL